MFSRSGKKKKRVVVKTVTVKPVGDETKQEAFDITKAIIRPVPPQKNEGELKIVVEEEEEDN